MKLVKGVQYGDEPIDEMTKLANKLIQVADADPDFAGAQVIIIVDRGEHGGIGATGFPETDTVSAVLANLFAHVQAVAKASGLNLSIMPLATRGRDS